VSPTPGDAAPSALRERISKFEQKGGTPVPRGSFGLGAATPEDTGASRRRGELYGNRVPGLSRTAYTPSARSVSAPHRVDEDGNPIPGFLSPQVTGAGYLSPQMTGASAYLSPQYTGSSMYLAPQHSGSTPPVPEMPPAFVAPDPPSPAQSALVGVISGSLMDPAEPAVVFQAPTLAPEDGGHEPADEVASTTTENTLTEDAKEEAPSAPVEELQDKVDRASPVPEVNPIAEEAPSAASPVAETMVTSQPQEASSAPSPVAETLHTSQPQEAPTATTEEPVSVPVVEDTPAPAPAAEEEPALSPKSVEAEEPTPQSQPEEKTVQEEPERPSVDTIREQTPSPVSTPAPVRDLPTAPHRPTPLQDLVPEPIAPAPASDPLSTASVYSPAPTESPLLSGGFSPSVDADFDLSPGLVGQAERVSPVSPRPVFVPPPVAASRPLPSPAPSVAVASPAGSTAPTSPEPTASPASSTSSTSSTSTVQAPTSEATHTGSPTPPALAPDAEPVLAPRKSFTSVVGRRTTLRQAARPQTTFDAGRARVPVHTVTDADMSFTGEDLSALLVNAALLEERLAHGRTATPRKEVFSVPPVPHAAPVAPSSWHKAGGGGGELPTHVRAPSHGRSDSSATLKARSRKSSESEHRGRATPTPAEPVPPLPDFADFGGVQDLTLAPVFAEAPARA
jgi:hypothetical protein